MGYLIELSLGDTQVSLEPERGGSVASFTHAGADILRPSTPGSILDTACFPLVPFSNRIADGRFVAHGKQYALSPNMPGEPAMRDTIHGYGWLSPWQVVDASESSASLVHNYEAGDWPWPYHAAQLFTVVPDGLQVSLSVTNCGETPMPSGLGFHPYFPDKRCAFYHGLHRGEWVVDDRCLPVSLREKVEPFDWWKGQAVSTRRVDTVYTGREGALQVAWPKKGFGVTISPSANLAFTTAYVPDDASFFCIEPVSHVTNAINLDRECIGLAWLDPGEALSVDIELRVERFQREAFGGASS
ncbi:MAG: aldose 1-epimerase [Novosphingobium sp.]|nr:aldose 1-epimerase [Novosphingobium sp.]MCP5400864.1 aldose 1-epimerase [Novosphingobium sp.]